MIDTFANLNILVTAWKVPNLVRHWSTPAHPHLDAGERQTVAERHRVVIGQVPRTNPQKLKKNRIMEQILCFEMCFFLL